MQTNVRWLQSFVVSTSIAVLACSHHAAVADTPNYFSVPAPPVRQGWPYSAPAQLFQPSTTSDTTTTNPLNLFNPASIANSGLNPNYLSSPFLAGSTPYFGGFPNSGHFGYSGGLGSFALRAAASQIPYVGGYAGSFGIPFLGCGWGGTGWGGYGSYGNFGYGGMPFGSSSFQGTVPNRIIQTGPSPSSGNYFKPAIADPSASGGYYASNSPAQAADAPVKTKNQPTSYYGKSGTDDLWGGGGSPLPKDLNSVPWAK